ncbi:MAG: GNAT family N-acetyltransferase [Caldilinea sp.]
MSSFPADPSYTRDLGHGLICRWSTAEDTARIAHCFATVHRPNSDASLNPRAADTIRAMMTPGFPFMDAGDFAIVEDVSLAERPVVACTCYWRHTWSYGGIPFGVGRPEMVATLPEYRNRGLVRALFEMVHARSAANNDLVQAITGIAYFYRQFGYEYVLDLEGQRYVNLTAIPELAQDAAEPYTLRLATFDDAPHLTALYNQGRSRSLVWHEADDDFWRAHLASWDDPALQGKDSTETALYSRLHMIVDAEGAVCGYVLPAMRRRGKAARIFALELYPHVSWLAAVPSLLRALRTHSEQIPAVTPDAGSVRELCFMLGRAHPAYTAMGEAIAARYEKPYAWYLRVPDLPRFLRHIAPVLEQRLADSIIPGHSGELMIELYRSRLKLVFERGRLISVEPAAVLAYGDDPPAGFPPLIFLQLIFGYRSLAQLRATFPDVYAEPEAAVLLDILFPELPSRVDSLAYV